MIDRKALLADLQKQVKALEVDLREQVDTEPEIGQRLRGEYDTAFKLGRTADTWRAWSDERITQAAVAWVLGTVFVRFCEDNRLVTRLHLAGPTTDSLVVAEEGEAQYFRADPDPTLRGWLLQAFAQLAESQAGRSLFDEKHNPLYGIPISHDGAKTLVAFWRRRDEDGRLIHRFESSDWDTRFLGDLYQDLSEAARKRYALLQTPEFVEEFILDRTLTPAIAEFGHEDLRMIDPTCGSGHFVLGAFHRILAEWEREAPGRDQHERVRRALDSVHGVDLNPFAVAIARFRLLIAALKASGVSTLQEAKTWEFPLNLAVGDSLIKFRDPGLYGAASAEEFAYSTEDIADHADILRSGSYHVVVGNPPYITVADPKLNDLYRRTYSDVCYRQYALSVPFAKRFFQLAKHGGGDGKGAGHVGQITSNSFMKREFGKNLINNYFSTWVNLTEIIDTSGAYIPGHGTPTVVLVGRNTNKNRGGSIRVAMSIRGEPGQPDEAAHGHVWTSIVNQIDRPGSETTWIGVDDVPRTTFATHPWSIAGGGATELTSQIEGAAAVRLSAVAKPGTGAVTRENEAYVVGAPFLRRRNIAEQYIRPLLDGEAVRDWAFFNETVGLWPYSPATLEASPDVWIERLLWPLRQQLGIRTAFGKTQLERGLRWTEYSMFFRNNFGGRTISYPLIATHNHFVLDRDSRVFTHAAPVLKMSSAATEQDHISLLGVLNSSTACFWLKQVSHNKGNGGIGGGIGDEDWEPRYELSGARLAEFPLPAVYPAERALVLDQLAQRLPALTPLSIAVDGVPTPERLALARDEYCATRAQMIALQEELDWEVYRLYGLLGDDLTTQVPPELNLGERAFEIVLARRMEAGEVETAWFERHGAARVTELPAQWPAEYKVLVERRIELIESNRNIGLIERPECKRRWQSDGWEAMQKRALQDWLADRCERRDLWYALDENGVEQPRPLTINQLADELRKDEDLLTVAAFFAPRQDLAKTLGELLESEHVPFLAALRYKLSGLVKRQDWEYVWDLQRQEDAAPDEDAKRAIRSAIPVPPKYTSADFVKQSYWQQRGKLDVPKERFISYLGGGRDVDPTLLLGWAGWDHREQAHALATLIADRQQSDGWDAVRLTPLLAGLREVMPWVRQWHGELDPAWGTSPADIYGGFLTDTAQRLHLTDEDLTGWRAPAARTRKTKNG